MGPGNDFLQMQRTKHVYEMEQRSRQDAEQILEEQRRLQQQQQQRPAPVMGALPTDAQITGTAQETRRPGFRERKKQRERQQADEKARKQEKRMRRKEVLRYTQRREITNRTRMTNDEKREERDLMLGHLESIRLREEADLLKPGLTDVQKQEISWKAQQERAKRVGDTARMMPVGSDVRLYFMNMKEAEELKADQMRKRYKLNFMGEEERAREEATLARHAKYDAAKEIFRADNPLSHEDAVWKHPKTQHTLVNVGRAYMGGTKPMYIFEDKEAPIIRDGKIVGYKQYLFKEAINCLGFHKASGALVTEAAASLQDMLCGSYSIPAFAAVQADGKVLGSFQERLDLMQEDRRVGLFKWQADPQNSGITIPPDMKKEILREHTLDWLLCNFDTKGENFLHRPDGHISSFDKEASFGKIKDEEAAHMSTTYKPHSNDTLYNTIFTEYAEGRIDLDLSANREQIEIVMNMSDEKYMGLFSNMLDEKYGKTGKKRQEMEDLIRGRKQNLLAEYKRFYSELIERRSNALGREATDDPNYSYVHERLDQLGQAQQAPGAAS